MLRLLQNSLLSGLSPRAADAPAVQPSGDTVDQRIRSLMEHPLYADPEDSRLRDHVAEEFARAYPGPAEPDLTGRLSRTAPAIRPEDVRPFPPPFVAPATTLRSRREDTLQPSPGRMARRFPEFGEVPPPVARPLADTRLPPRAEASPPVVSGREPLRHRPRLASSDGRGGGNSCPFRVSKDRGNETGAWSRPKNPVPGETKAELLVYGGKLLGLPQAARALDHYRGGSGRPLEMPAEWLRAHEEIRRAEGENQTSLVDSIKADQELIRQLETLEEGQSVSRTLHKKNKNINAKGQSDLHYASGLSNLDSSAIFTFTREGGRIVMSGEQEHRWHDVYDWQKGTKFLHGLVTGDEMIELETRGKAKTFEMIGGWSGKVTGSIPIGPDGRLGEPDFDWTGGQATAKRRDP